MRGKIQVQRVSMSAIYFRKELCFWAPKVEIVDNVFDDRDLIERLTTGEQNR